MRETREARTSSETLLFTSASQHLSWEYEIARGGVAGVILAWTVDEQSKGAWKDALKAAIPTSFDDAAWLIWDIGSQLNESGSANLHNWFSSYPPYEQLARNLQSIDELITRRHQWLFSRLGVDAVVLVE